MSLVKKLYFDSDVLGILRSMEFSADGLLGKLTCGQLDRKMYEKVNKALDAMGGKWNKKSGGHLFQTDPRPSVEGLLENGVIEVKRDGFFETPKAVVERMLELVPINGRHIILEPSAGMGAIANELPAEKGLIVCVEKNEDRAGRLEDMGFETYCCDFLEWQPSYKFELIYMNPPFEELQDIDHVKHAYELLVDYGSMASVMSESPFFRSDRKAADFRAWLESVGGHYEKLADGAFKESGTGVNARLVVIHNGVK